MFTETKDLHRRAARFAALADPIRLSITDLLAWGDLSPGELQSRLVVSSSLLAHHLSVLQDEGIVERTRSEGDGRRTYVQLVPGSLSGLMVWPSHVAQRVLFVCTANSARSQLAAALWSQYSSTPSASAGTHPARQIDPRTVAVARRERLRLQDGRPRQLSETLTDSDFVVTVCDSAHEELGGRADAHWSVPDPVRAGSDGAFDDAFAEISRRVSDLYPRLMEPSKRK